VIEAHLPERAIRCANVTLMGRGGTYRLEVQGHLGDLTSHSFPRMRIRYKNGNTLLVGPVRDQAELTGLLQRFSDLGLNLVSVTALDEPTSGS
jgi:hypothetical protein